MAALNVTVVSAEREIWTGEAALVVARTLEGEIGIMRGHQPVLAVLDSGEVRLTLESGEKVTVDAEGGFFSVDHDVVTIVAGAASIVA